MDWQTSKQVVDEIIQHEENEPAEPGDTPVNTREAALEMIAEAYRERAVSFEAQTRQLEREMKYRCDAIVDIANMLAECGSYDHKGKNECILRAIAGLLGYRNPGTLFSRNLDTDGIPW